ncbi:hypothetical protein CGRA01v4_14544 [Colletotrichum graminicola]|nr:hypothetical protein CGRA01v4_14544 [Colletotrichum graminicola]
MCHALPPFDQLHPSFDARSEDGSGELMSDQLSTGTRKDLDTSRPAASPLRPNEIRRRRRSPNSRPEMKRVACPKILPRSTVGHGTLLCFFQPPASINAHDTRMTALTTHRGDGPILAISRSANTIVQCTPESQPAVGLFRRSRGSFSTHKVPRCTDTATINVCMVRPKQPRIRRRPD